MSPARLFTVVVAAGEGTRLGTSGRKAGIEFAGGPLVLCALRTLSAAPGRVGGALVVHAEDVGRAETEWITAPGVGDHWTVVPGGATRGASTEAGLAVAPEDAELLLVHDAARPLLSIQDRDAVIEAATQYGAAILASPIADTIHRVENDRIVGGLDRTGLWGAQTPQVFRRDAADRARRSGPIEGTDEAGWLATASVDVRVVPAHDPNPKLTTPADRIALEAAYRAAFPARADRRAD